MDFVLWRPLFHGDASLERNTFLSRGHSMFEGQIHFFEQRETERERERERDSLWEARMYIVLTRCAATNEPPHRWSLSREPAKSDQTATRHSGHTARRGLAMRPSYAFGHLKHVRQFKCAYWCVCVCIVL